MQIKEFKSMLKMFADPNTELLFEKDKLLMQVNGDIIEVEVSSSSGEISIIENDRKVLANTWIINRLARLPLLASRLRDNLARTENFISPSASYLPSLESKPDEETEETDDAERYMSKILDKMSPFETDVIYITSDAGEGKTSLINQLAYRQAESFINSETSWLLVPIPLGGRNFMRFDDITIGALQNRYRFPFLYYHSFLALVKMGAIIPAFDGFEEMFVETNSGEALSAMGILVDSLESQGSLVISARKAYFEFENLKAQEKLFDTVRSNNVNFEKLELLRWSKEDFIQYCKLRNIDNPSDLYSKISKRLGKDHALLTRAVLIKRLIDIVKNTDTIENFITKLSGENYFSIFVHKIIEREANEKWIDRSGENEVGAPLLTIDEHIQLLSEIAISMWESKTDYLKKDGLEFVAEYYCEVVDKNAYQTQQIRERICGHAMLIPSINVNGAVEFDHDEFKYYFLGDRVGKLLLSADNKIKADIFSIFRRGILPTQSLITIINVIEQAKNDDKSKIIQYLISISGMDIQTSYTHENCSSIMVRILSKNNFKDLKIENMLFGSNALQDKELTALTFDSCHFSSSSLEYTKIKDCKFIDCRFNQLRIHENTKFINTSMDNCIVESIAIVQKKIEYWEPNQIISQLSSYGIELSGIEDYDKSILSYDFDLDLKDFGKLTRYFMRSTHIGESVIKIKLGKTGQRFIDEIVPLLLDNGVFVEIENRGGVNQRRFRLNKPLENIHNAISTSKGSFSTFLKSL